jgi:hypothetical protein
VTAGSGRRSNAGKPDEKQIQIGKSNRVASVFSHPSTHEIGVAQALFAQSYPHFSYLREVQGMHV